MEINLIQFLAEQYLPQKAAKFLSCSNIQKYFPKMCDCSKSKVNFSNKQKISYLNKSISFCSTDPQYYYARNVQLIIIYCKRKISLCGHSPCRSTHQCPSIYLWVCPREHMGVILHHSRGHYCKRRVILASNEVINS